MTCQGCDNATAQEVMREMGVDPKNPPKFPGSYLWRGLGEDVERRIDSTLRMIQGTPYRSNGRVVGEGLDCRTSVAAFLDTMNRTDTPMELASVPTDSGYMDTPQARRAMKQLVRNAGAVEVSSAGVIEPGDVVCTRGLSEDDVDIPAHCLIAGVKPHTLYHAPLDHQPFQGTSVAAAGRIVAIYRPDKGGW